MRRLRLWLMRRWMGLGMSVGRCLVYWGGVAAHGVNAFASRWDVVVPEGETFGPVHAWDRRAGVE